MNRPNRPVVFQPKLNDGDVYGSRVVQSVLLVTAYHIHVTAKFFITTMGSNNSKDEGYSSGKSIKFI